MLIALVLVGTWAYLGVRRTVCRQLDGTLRATSLVVSDALDNDPLLAQHRGHPDRRDFVSEFNRLVVLRNSQGTIVQANSPLARTLALDTAEFRAAQHGERPLVTTRWEGEPVRAIYVPAPGTLPAEAAVVEIAMSLVPLQRDLRTILLLMAATVGLASLATFIGSGWLARSALRPVDEIAHQAAAISGGLPDERITVHVGVVEFKRLIDVLNDMVARLERASAWHRRIVRDLGHDLRTPITALRAGVEVALWGERRPDEYRRTLGSAMEEVERLTLISDALVLLGRLESGELQVNRTMVDLVAISRSAVDRVQQRIGAHVFRFQHPGATVPVLGDERLLGLAVDQLLDNAKRHTPAGTVVEVSLRVTGTRVELAIEDDGPGAPDELLPHLFERFFRTDPARGRESGPGLGLTLVAEIVDRHGGRAHAERAGSGGLRVKLELPHPDSTAIPNESAS